MSESDLDPSAPPAAAVPDELRDLPTSCELVYGILERADEPLTHKDISYRTHRPDRTVRYAIERLREETDLIEERPNTRDARQYLYRVKCGSER